MLGYKPFAVAYMVVLNNSRDPAGSGLRARSPVLSSIGSDLRGKFFLGSDILNSNYF
jgi:hypothetical protein